MGVEGVSDTRLEILISEMKTCSCNTCDICAYNYDKCKFNDVVNSSIIFEKECK